MGNKAVNTNWDPQGPKAQVATPLLAAEKGMNGASGELTNPTVYG